VKKKRFSPSPQPYVVGNRFDLQPFLYRASSATLFVFAESNCGACRRAAPFFRRLDDTISSRARIVLASGDSGSRQVEFAREIGLGTDSIFVVTMPQKAMRVPTIGVVDATGFVRFAFEGVVGSAAVEQSTIRAILALIPPRSTMERGSDGLAPSLAQVRK
jgi:hypothetical protein